MYVQQQHAYMYVYTYTYIIFYYNAHRAKDRQCKTSFCVHFLLIVVVAGTSAATTAETAQNYSNKF